MLTLERISRVVITVEYITVKPLTPSFLSYKNRIINKKKYYSHISAEKLVERLMSPKVKNF